jgi:hypothetical protein
MAKRLQPPRAEAIMAVDEGHRHALHEAARRSFGFDQGDTLMELLPLVGWADVATKQDLLALEERLELRLAILVERQLRELTWRLSGLLFVAFGIFAALVRVV